MNIKAFFKNFDWSFFSILKVIWMALLWVFGIWIIISVFWLMFSSLSDDNYRWDFYWQDSYIDWDFSRNYISKSEWLSIWKSNDIEALPEAENVFTAEDFEIKEHSATIRSSNVSWDCSKFLKLKERDDVIVETSNVSEENCNFSFKIVKEKWMEIVDFIKEFKPYYFNTHIYSIQQSIKNLVSELSILEKKLKSTETTLLNAQTSYDELIILAKNKNDIESLTKLIDWKLNLINRLTRERQGINIQIVKIKKSQAEQLDRLKYTFFNVNIYEDKIVNFKQIKESWKNELKQLVNSFNDVLQWVSINVVSYCIKFIEFVVYFFISLIFLKFLWFIVKKIWFLWNSKKIKK